MSPRHVFSRREFLSTALALGVALPLGSRAASAAGSNHAVCTLTPEQEVGPYYLDEALLRRDVTEGKPGVPLVLDIALLDAKTCAPLSAAYVDIWQCDAMGRYSGFVEAAKMPPPVPGRPPFMPGGHPPGPPPSPHPTDRLTFLRGTQQSDAAGRIEFVTIVPGNYPGRTNHIHFKVREPASTSAASHVAHVGQIFLPEDLVVRLMQLDPYREHRIRRTPLHEDGIFMHQHADSMIARVEPLHGDDMARGLRASITAAIDPQATPQPAASGAPGGFPPAAEALGDGGPPRPGTDR